jgi:hypothetical protein
MQHAPMQHATRTDATCNAHRCNMPHATRTDAPCNAPRCNPHRCDILMQNTKRSIAPMQRAPMYHADARRCNMDIACRTAHPVPHAPWRHRAATWLRHIVCLDAYILPPCAPSIGRAAPRNAPSHGAGRATRAGRTHRLGVRDRAALERDGPIPHAHHAAAAILRTSRQSQGYRNRPRIPSTDTHPTAHRPGSRRRPAPHAPFLLRCRISPRRRRARCPWPCGARHHRRPAHECIAPPLGRRKSPPFAKSRSARAADSKQRTGRPCAAGRLRVADATCNAQKFRCNMQHATRADATRADATRHARRCNAPRALMHYPTRHACRCIMQHATRIDAPCNAQ